VSYWNGCSTGGRQGLKEAQMFPDDYDGIIAGAPANRTAISLWIADAVLKDPASYIPPAKYPVIHKAAVAACDANDGLDDGAARRRAADREQEQDSLPNARLTEAPHLGLHANGPRGGSRGADDDELRTCRLADLALERARSHGVEPEPTPPETRDDEDRSDRGDARSVCEHGDRRQSNPRSDGQLDPPEGDDVGDRDADAARTDQQRRPLVLDHSPHGVTRSRSCSIRVGPIPGTASRSSTDLNGPCSAR